MLYTFRGTFKYTDILNLSNPSRITDVEKLQEEIQIDESFNVQFTSVCSTYFYGFSVLMFIII